jgi:hypothetical protein
MPKPAVPGNNAPVRALLFANATTQKDGGMHHRDLPVASGIQARCDDTANPVKSSGCGRSHTIWFLSLLPAFARGNQREQNSMPHPTH